MPTVPSSNLTAINNLGANFPGSPAQSGLVIGPTVSGTANSIIQDDSISTVLANFWRWSWLGVCRDCAD